MAVERIEVVGLARLRRTMRQAGLDVAELKDLNRAAASIVSPWVTARTPVGPPEGGHLKTTVRVGAAGNAGVVRIGNKGKPYAGPVHWGWPARNIKPNTWATDAARASETAWTEVYVRGINRILDKVEGA